jgi:hypothetical protein
MCNQTNKLEKYLGFRAKKKIIGINIQSLIVKYKIYGKILNLSV